MMKSIGVKSKREENKMIEWNDQPIGLGELAETVSRSPLCNREEIIEFMQAFVETMKVRLLQGQGIFFPGLGVLKVEVRPSRIVSANFNPKNPTTYQTGVRPSIKLEVDGPFLEELILQVGTWQIKDKEKSKP